MYERTHMDHYGVHHIVAMPASHSPFAACGAFHLPRRSEGMFAFPKGVANCVPCWAREIAEWQHEADEAERRKQS